MQPQREINSKDKKRAKCVTLASFSWWLRMPHSATGQEAAGIECKTKRTTGCRWVESWRILGNQDRLPLRDVETSSPLPYTHTHTPTHRHTQHTPDTRKSILNFSTSRALPVGPPPPPGRCLVHSQSRNCQPMPRGGMAGCSIGRRSVRIENGG